ncbi:MAG: D-alanine--poly(phosphoribitol) ligase subunit DltA [Clostridiales Family XIII bacterium]|jgi:D-alanine--poly(phosphoribitol) ligase subunit 1|nr:D-alanine--poly(phosphoribitol) ligase subunit DltA [Clostridiales Family XIII bacterium]
MSYSTIISKIDNWATTTPMAICYEDGAGAHSYKELKVQSDAVAAGLLRRFSDRRPVIVYGALSFDMIACFLGCIKAGHAYIPVDNSTPDDRLEAIVHASNCACVIAVTPWSLEIGESMTIDCAEKIHSIEIFTPCDFLEDHDNDMVTQPRCPVTGDENFYIIFTSGTTGQPKGVQISHNNLLSFTDWIKDDFGIDSGKRFLLQAPFSFDLSVMSLYPALLSGGTLLAFGKEIIGDFARLSASIKQAKIDIWVSTPSFADICLADPEFNSANVDTVTHFLFCGEELLNKAAGKLKKRFPVARIFNTYGPTEAAVAVTSVEITEDLLSDYARLPVGIAKQDTTIAILDSDGTLLPDGAEGEICIAGPPVSKGYLNDAERTKQSFFELDDSTVSKNTNWESAKSQTHTLHAYRTGDAGLLKNGMLFFKGRLDFQVKFHGYRIELEDIERHLTQLPYVESALVIPKFKDEKVQRLIAYVAPSSTQCATKVPYETEYEFTSALKQGLQSKVMSYMVPQKFIYIDHLPLSKNGKVDRKKLIDEVNPK